MVYTLIVTSNRIAKSALSVFQLMDQKQKLASEQHRTEHTWDVRFMISFWINSTQSNRVRECMWRPITVRTLSHFSEELTARPQHTAIPCFQYEWMIRSVATPTVIGQCNMVMIWCTELYLLYFSRMWTSGNAFYSANRTMIHSILLERIRDFFS